MHNFILIGAVIIAMLTTSACDNQADKGSAPSASAALSQTAKPTQTDGSTKEINTADSGQNPSSTQNNNTDAPVQTSGTAQENKEENTVNIVIEMQDGGIIKAELYPDIAPITVANFEKLINEKFFDGLIFHRVISGFMIQGGGFDTNYEQKKADSIKGEFSANGVENNLKHDRGVLSMARTQIMDSASSQFFIMHETSPHLDGNYAAFGKVTEGMDVVDKIASVKTDANDCPVEPQVIKSITIAE